MDKYKKRYKIYINFLNLLDDKIKKKSLLYLSMI